ncbi:MAG: hypothetical protein C5B50_07745 [Verrucomicrobia bacterium]|nr:MAG: hypothetical protein C5B50_07745 [Verrucomicrobiota bacterium]
MKTTLTIIATALVTWLLITVVHAFHTAWQHAWMDSNVEVPGRMALIDIQKDMNEKRYNLAKAKLQVFLDTWQRFGGEPKRPGYRGLGDILISFSKLETNAALTNVVNEKVQNH